MDAEFFEKNSRDFNKTLIFADCHYIECCYSYCIEGIEMRQLGFKVRRLLFLNRY
jgi:hypothetical protein